MVVGCSPAHVRQAIPIACRRPQETEVCCGHLKARETYDMLKIRLFSDFV